jgi:hypothetical protein
MGRKDLKDGTLKMIDGKVVYVGENIAAEMSMEVNGRFC